MVPAKQDLILSMGARCFACFAHALCHANYAEVGYGTRSGQIEIDWLLSLVLAEKPNYKLPLAPAAFDCITSHRNLSYV